MSIYIYMIIYMYLGISACILIFTDLQTCRSAVQTLRCVNSAPLAAPLDAQTP